MDGNGGIATGGQILLELHPTSMPGRYAIELSHRSIEGGWPTVFEALLAGLGVVVKETTQQQSAAENPVFQAMCNVFRECFRASVQTQGQAPRVERVQELPPTMPSVKEWFKN